MKAGAACEWEILGTKTLCGLLKARGHFNSCDNKCLRFACIRGALDAWHVAGPVFVQARMANRTRSLRRVSSPGFCHTYIRLHCTRCTHPTRANDIRMFSTRQGLARRIQGRFFPTFKIYTRWKESRCQNTQNTDFYIKLKKKKKWKDKGIRFEA